MHDHKDEPIDINLLEEMGYERSDVKMGVLSKSIAGFFLASTVVMAVGVFCMWVAAPNMTFKAPKEKTQERRRMPEPNAPLIQSGATALKDMHELIKEQREQQSTYAWTDRKSGHVRVPIDVAMKAVLDKGLPSRVGGQE